MKRPHSRTQDIAIEDGPLPQPVTSEHLQQVQDQFQSLLDLRKIPPQPSFGPGPYYWEDENQFDRMVWTYFELLNYSRPSVMLNIDYRFPNI